MDGSIVPNLKFYFRLLKSRNSSVMIIGTKAQIRNEHNTSTRLKVYGLSQLLVLQVTQRYLSYAINSLSISVAAQSKA
jgi:hypothetical protein